MWPLVGSLASKERKKKKDLQIITSVIEMSILKHEPNLACRKYRKCIFTVPRKLLTS
jgi:hypothetical protein